MPRTKQITYPERQRRKRAAQVRRTAMRDELLSLRLANARVKAAAIERAEKERKRDEFLDALYCGKHRAMLEKVEYQQRAGEVWSELWIRSRDTHYDEALVEPQHAALLVHYELTPTEPELPFEERLRLRHKELAAQGIFRGAYRTQAKQLEESAAPMDTPRISR